MALVVVAFLGACTTDGWNSWFGGMVAQKQDEAPPPDAAPAEPVESVTLAPPMMTASNQAQPALTPAATPAQTAPPSHTPHTKVGILLPLVRQKRAALGRGDAERGANGRIRYVRR